MTLLDTLKSLLGLESSEDRAGDDDVGVTVEREPGQEPEPVSSPSGSPESEAAEPDAGEPSEDDAGEPSEDDDAEAADAGPEATDADEQEGAPGDEDDAGDEDADAGEPAAGTDESTDVIEGIGPAYSERLADAGVETVADLAAADAEALAAEVDNVGAGRLETWIERAKNR